VLRARGPARPVRYQRTCARHQPTSVKILKTTVPPVRSTIVSRDLIFFRGAQPAWLQRARTTARRLATGQSGVGGRRAEEIQGLPNVRDHPRHECVVLEVTVVAAKTSAYQPTLSILDKSPA